jgi:hypothetical protein
MIDIRKYTEIMKCEREYKKLYNANHKMNIKLGNASKEMYDAIKAERDITSKACDDYANSVYARTVFETFRPLNPMMVERKTGEHLPFCEAFGDTFAECQKKGMCAILVGLMQGGRYGFGFGIL